MAQGLMAIRNERVDGEGAPAPLNDDYLGRDTHWEPGETKVLAVEEAIHWMLKYPAGGDGGGFVPVPGGPASQAPDGEYYRLEYADPARRLVKPFFQRRFDRVMYEFDGHGPFELTPREFRAFSQAMDRDGLVLRRYDIEQIPVSEQERSEEEQLALFRTRAAQHYGYRSQSMSYRHLSHLMRNRDPELFTQIHEEVYGSPPS